MQSFLYRQFHLEERGSSPGRELRGALATFLTMVYILVLNPAILSNANIPLDSAFTCTALAAGICCLLMGFLANFPIALASGMGLNALVAFQITNAMGSWQAAMGLVILDGIVVMLLVLGGVREAMLQAIPLNLRRTISAGIGLFIAFIGLANSKVVVPAPELGVPLTMGDLSQSDALVAIAGFLLTAVLLAQRVRGAIILGIVLSALLYHVLNGAVPSFTWKAPNFEILGQADVVEAFQWKWVPLLLTILMVDFFDTLGTVTATAEQAQIRDSQGNVPGLRRILLVDSASASIGGFCGASSVTSYIESASGISEGARTGLHSVLVGLFFLLMIPFAPLAGMVPLAATAPALILVGFLMCEQIAKLDFEDRDTAIPAFITLIAIPLTYSITAGIGFGFLSFVVIKLLSLKFREVHPLMYAATALFLLHFLQPILFAK